MKVKMTSFAIFHFPFILKFLNNIIVIIDRVGLPTLELALKSKLRV